MERPQTRPDIAPTAPHAAPGPAPAPGAAPAPGSPAAAVQAALAASPGGTVAAIARAAETGKAAARDALLAMEQAGAATRVKGGRPGVPDTWTLAGAAPDAPGAPPDPEQDRGTRPGDDPDDPGAGAKDGEMAPDAAAATAVPPVPDDGDAVPDGGPQEQDEEDPARDGEPGGAGREDGDAPGRALAEDVTGQLARIRAAADAAEAALAAGPELGAALAALDQIGEHAAQGRRSLKAAIGGRKTPAARPGSLRERVLAHLGAHPDGEFTPHEIHNVLGNSSGAIANALDTLVRRGEAELAAEKPRRFRSSSRAAAPAAPEPAGAGSADGDRAELAGAA